MITQRGMVTGDDESPVYTPASNKRRATPWTLLNLVLIVGILHFARGVLIPVAMAVLLTFVLTPVVTFFQRYLKSRVLSVVLVVVLSVGLVGGTFLTVSQQFLSLTRDLPVYRDTIARKVRAIKLGTGHMVASAAETIEAVGSEFAAKPPAEGAPAEGTPSAAAPAPAPSEPSPAWNPMSLVGALLGSILEIIATAATVILLLVMMLMGRESIRDRVIRLAGRQHVSLTTQSLETAGARVGGYLIGHLVVNAFHGVAIGIGLYFIGVPSPAVCGILAALLRFVPIIGPWLGAVVPGAMAAAMFDDWRHVAMVVGLFCVVETINSFALEPWIYGSRTGLSSLGFVLAIVFWTAVWGPVGLLLAMPVTVCLLAFARQMPQLKALTILLGDEPALPLSARFYQRLLSGDEDEAAKVLREAADSQDPVATIERVPLATLNETRHDLQMGAITPEQADRVAGDVMDLTLEWLADLWGPQEDSAPAVTAILPARDEGDHAAARILARVLEHEGIGATVASPSLLLNEMIEAAVNDQAALIVLSTVEPSTDTHTRRLCKAIVRRLPGLSIVVANWGARRENTDAPFPLGPAGALVCTLPEVLAAVRNRVAEHRVAAKELPGADQDLPDPPGRPRPEPVGR